MNKAALADYRLGGEPLWYTSPREDREMRVPDEIKECVVFLGRSAKTKANQLRFESLGTGFLISIGTLEQSFIYLVTAKHVVDEFPASGKFYIRANTLDGKAKLIASEDSPIWYFHPKEKSVDVAVYPWAPPDGIARKFIPEAMIIASDETLRARNIGIGDDAVITGLFSIHEGKKRNEPIIRTGSIAMLPTEKIADKNYGDIDAYLIEARSLGGMSGCPVFARQYMPRDSQTWTQWYYLIGLMLGHWDVPEKIKKQQLRGINMGIAITVPAKKIMEVINQPALAIERQRALNAIKSSIIKD